METQVGERYRHYKNEKEYTVLAVGYYTESDPLMPCVVYQAEYNDPQLGERPIFIRPKEMFESVIEEDPPVNRFTLIT